MNKKDRAILASIFAITITIIIIVLTNTQDIYYGAQEVYHVYLNGKSIGYTESKKDLEKYIDEKALKIKEEYKTDKVYAPTGLLVNQEITYNTKISTTEDIYDKIKNEQDFTIDGYRITINHTKKQTGNDSNDNDKEKEDNKEYIYVLDKKHLTDAINTVVLSFIDEKEYKKYLEEQQEEITDEGTIIENVYLKEEITIKKDLVPVNKRIFKDDKDLAEFLLFGSLDKKTKYKVKAGDTVSSIAKANKLNTQELLTANRDIAGENALLYLGQEVVVSLINPVITVVEEEHTVELQTVKFKTEIQEDTSKYYGYSEVIQKGVNGQNLVTKKTKKENGQTTNVVNISSVVVKPAVNKILKTGSRNSLIVSANGIWAWPTRSGYTLTDGYEWRWGSLHAAQDIAGLGCNSPIYAANDGTVTMAHPWGGGTSGLNSLGNYIVIQHKSGYSTGYAHLTKMYVKEGDYVEMGQVIGTMGDTGFSFGCHLHFIARYNGETFDPMQLYR